MGVDVSFLLVSHSSVKMLVTCLWTPLHWSGYQR